MSDYSSEVLDPHAEQARLQSYAQDIIDEAKRQGATACEVGIRLDAGLSVDVRLGDVETVEFNRDQGMGITVYFGHKKGSASTTDGSHQSIKETIKAACDIARFTSEDPDAGLAGRDLIADAKQLPDLELFHPWHLSASDAIDLALECEHAARHFDDHIVNSEGAHVNSTHGVRVYANSNGFLGGYGSSRHSLSAVMIGKKDDDMQRDYWYTVNRDAAQLESAVTVGEKAAQRTVERLGARKINTGNMPVIFSPDMAAGLISLFLGAISGSALYRQSSFMIDQLGKPVFPDWVRIHESPLLKRRLGSMSFDGDGLATYAKDFVTDGVLSNYILSTYTGRKLGMPTTANAGGISNIFVEANAQSQQNLIKQMGTGLLITEMMGQGVNPVTGDYSRGAGGFWIENGEIAYPVSEVTVAGNLKQMYQNIVAIGSDVDLRGSVLCGSMLMDGLMVSGES